MMQCQLRAIAVPSKSVTVLRSLSTNRIDFLSPYYQYNHPSINNMCLLSSLSSRCYFASSVTRVALDHVTADVGRLWNRTHITKSLLSTSPCRYILHARHALHNEATSKSTPSRPNSLSAVGQASSESASSLLPPLHRPLVVHNIPATVPYSMAWNWQKQIVRQKIQFERSLKSLNKQHSQSSSATSSADFSLSQNSTMQPGYADRLLIVEHQPVYTLGRNSSLEHLRFPPHIRVQIDESRSGQAYPAEPADSPSSPQQEEVDYHVVRVERGGEVTYHGPGQIVLYPLLALQPQPMTSSCSPFPLSSSPQPLLQPSPYRADLHWFLRSLENVVIRFLATFDVLGERLEGASGVWVDLNKLRGLTSEGRCMKKLSAVGLSCSSWVSMHGIAINVTNDLSAFDWIVPCGLSDSSKYAGVTSLREVIAIKQKHHEREPNEMVPDVSWEAVLDESQIRERILKCFIDEFQLQHVDVTASPPSWSDSQHHSLSAISKNDHNHSTLASKDTSSTTPFIPDKAAVQEQHVETAA